MFNNYHFTDMEKKELLNSRVILVDTREKSNSHILEYFKKKNISYKDKVLDSGDYSVMIPKNEKFGIFRDVYLNNNIIIERKNSLEELSGNFTKERERFENEFRRCSDKSKKYLLIENANLTQILEHEYNTQFNANSYIASLITYTMRYNLVPIFVPLEQAGKIINIILFQYLSNLFK